MKNTETIKENRERIEHLLVVRNALDMYLKFWEEGEVGTDFQSRVKNSIIKELQNIETKLEFLGDAICLAEDFRNEFDIEED
jgi:hypothetical protein